MKLKWAMACATLAFVTTNLRADDDAKTKKPAGKVADMLKQHSKEAFHKADENKDGSLNKEEFSKAMQHFRERLMQARGGAGGEGKRKAAKGEGKASKAEGKAGKGDGKNLGEAAFDQADADHDGKVTEKEFTTFVDKIAQRMMQRRSGTGGAAGRPAKGKVDGGAGETRKID